MRRLVLLAALWAGPALAADPAAEGKQVFARVGCYECHGYAGQGGIEGPKLAPDPPAYPALAAFVRGTTGAMPAYSPKILPDADLQKIYAYLKSIKKAPPVNSVPLLRAIAAEGYE